jgi:hypothetical protein
MANWNYVGIPHLDRQIGDTTTIMAVSEGKEDFERLFEHRFGKQTLTKFWVAAVRLAMSVIADCSS